MTEIQLHKTTLQTLGIPPPQPAVLQEVKAAPHKISSVTTTRSQSPDRPPCNTGELALPGHKPTLLSHPEASQRQELGALSDVTSSPQCAINHHIRAHRIIGWKRPLRSSSPTINPTPLCLEHLQGWGLQQFPSLERGQLL